MAIDRGELRYTLTARDRFRTTFRDFRREIDASVRALRDLDRARRAVRTDIADPGATRQQQQQARAARESAAARREETQRLRALNAQVQERARVERELGRITRQANLDRQRAAAQSARTQREAERAQRRATEAARQQRRELLGLNREGNRLLFTFRRLVGALAAFALARQAASSFRDLVSLGVRFNAELQASRVGFAGIIASAGRITDLQGRQLRGQEAFNAAVRAGERVQQTLLVRSLETTATVSELGVAFQQAVGPGLARGLNIDQISELSVLISQAATSINLSQQQLAEETRSILSGTARAQTTRLAALFGGAAELNQLVRTAADGNELFSELTERLGGTAEAARRIANEIPGLANRIRGALEVVTGAAAVDFSETLRTTLQDIFNTLVQVNEQTGLLEPTPEALAAFAAIFDALDRIAGIFRGLAGEIGFGGLAQAGATLAAGLEIAAAAVVGIVRGVRQAFAVISAVFQPVIRIAEAFGLTDGSVQDVVSRVTQLITLIAVARAGVALLAGGFTRLVAIVSLLSGPLANVLTLIGRIPPRLFQIVAVFGALVFAAQAVSSEILGIDVSLRDLPEVFGTLVEQVATKTIGLGRTIFATIRRGAILAFQSVLTAAGNAITRLKAFFDLELGASEDLSRLAAAERQNEINARNIQLKELEKRLDQEIAEIEREQAQISEDANRRAGERIRNLEQEIERRRAALTTPVPEVDDNAIAARAQELLEKFREAFGQAQGGDEGLPFDIGPRDEQVTDQARQQLQQAQAQAAVTRQQVLGEQELFRLRQAGATVVERDLAAARNRIAVLTVERQNRIQAAGLAEQQLQRDLRAANGEEAKANIQAQIIALRQQEAAETERTTLEIEKQRVVIEELRRQVDGVGESVRNFGLGFAQGLRGFAERFASAFQAGVNIAQGITQRFTSFVADSVVDALDPTTDTDLRERFARFLQDIARLILQQLVQLAIAKAILGLGIGAPVGGFSSGGPVTVPNFAEGGNVPGGPSFESRPPPGAPRSDTVLARLTPGEWVNPVHTVARMGADFFDRLRAGAGDPMALRALVGLGTRSRARSVGRSGPYFQTGGLVSEQLRQVREASERADANRRSGGGGGDGGEVLPVVPATNATMEKLLQGGKGAMLSFLRKNQTDSAGTRRR